MYAHGDFLNHISINFVDIFDIPLFSALSCTRPQCLDVSPEKVCMYIFAFVFFVSSFVGRITEFALRTRCQLWHTSL
jgi:hypothetical protein